MKNLFFNLKIFISLLLLVIASSIKAQGISGTPVLSEGCLGIHCYVTVDLDNDPVVNGGYVKYTIPTPRENLDYIQGPAGAYLSNNLGNTVDIYVRKIHLELALSDYVAVEVPFELFVKKWILPNGGTYDYPVSGAAQCFYYVVFMINSLN